MSLSELFEKHRPCYTVKTAYTVQNRDGTKSLTVPAGFKSDLYTDVPDLPDPKPAVTHDRAYDVQVWDDDTPMTFDEANDLFLLLGQQSSSFWTRFWIPVYFRGVELFGWKFWNEDKPGHVFRS